MFTLNIYYLKTSFTSDSYQNENTNQLQFPASQSSPSDRDFETSDVLMLSEVSPQQYWCVELKRLLEVTR